MFRLTLSRPPLLRLSFLMQLLFLAASSLRAALEAREKKDADGMSKDEDLKSLRGKLEFRELVAEARKSAAAGGARTKKPE